AGPSRDPATEAALAVAGAMNAVASVDPRAQFRLRTSGWGSAPGDGGSGIFWIVGELDFRTRRELAWTAGATAEVSVTAEDGRQVLSADVPVQPSEGAF